MEEETRFAKGKRTKRSRPVGPISSSGGSHSDGAAASSSTTTTSTKFSDEDMAHCLILLAQSRSRSPESMKPLVLHDTGREVFVYQCKTCDRCFPSFQALGGHRASHKKLKPPLAEDKSESTDYGSSLKLSLQLGIRTQPALATKVPPRVHECSLCGAEFGSGQALGGHMRRHRTLTATPLAAVIPDIKDSDGRRISFDLNIPPAPEAEFEGNSFVFSSTKNRTPVFPTSDLVHCHY